MNFALSLLGLFYISASLVLLPASFILDKWGHRATLGVVSTFIPVTAYSIFLGTNLTPYVGCILLGTAHGLLPAVAFPAVALIVEPHLVGTAYGIITFFINLALFLSPLYLGLIQDITGLSDVGDINRWRMYVPASHCRALTSIPAAGP